MRITRPLLLAATFLVGLTGCITIEEQYSFKKNGSGTMTYVLDMREMGEMLKSFGDGEKKDDTGAEGQMNITGHAEALKSIAGVSKVKLDTRTEWLQKITFAFTDVAALNRALNTLMPDSNNTAHEFFRWEDGTLVRTTNNFVYDMSSTMASEAAESGDGEDGEDGEDSGFDMSSMLGMMKYKYSFKFQQPIGSTEAADVLTKESTGSKEVKLSTDWAAIAKDRKALDLRIVLNR